MRIARHNFFTLAAFPILFVALTAALLYNLILPVVRPYVELAGLFVSSTPLEPARQDLFAEAAAAQASASVDGRNDGDSASNTVPTGPAMIPESTIIMPNDGDLYGRLTIDGTSIDAPIYWDDSPRELNLGIGTYTGGWLPGFGRTIMLAGHRDSWLKDLKSAQFGGVITVETHYGTYTYEITDIAVHHMDDSSAYDFDREDENIIIYTCYPFDYIGAAKERYFVYGELLAGLQVDLTS